MISPFTTAAAGIGVGDAGIDVGDVGVGSLGGTLVVPWAAGVDVIAELQAANVIAATANKKFSFEEFFFMATSFQDYL